MQSQPDLRGAVEATLIRSNDNLGGWARLGGAGVLSTKQHAGEGARAFESR